MTNTVTMSQNEGPRYYFNGAQNQKQTTQHSEVTADAESILRRDAVNNNSPASVNACSTPQQCQSPDDSCTEVNRDVLLRSDSVGKSQQQRQQVPVDIVRVSTRGSQSFSPERSPTREADDNSASQRTSSFSSFKPQIKAGKRQSETSTFDANPTLSPQKDTEVLSQQETALESQPALPPRQSQTTQAVNPSNRRQVPAPVKAPVLAPVTSPITSPVAPSVGGTKRIVDQYKFEDEEPEVAAAFPPEVTQGHQDQVVVVERPEEDTVDMDVGSEVKAWFDAIESGDVGKVQEILEAGSVDVSVRNRDKQTGLIVVAKNGNLDIVNILLEEGIDVNTQGSNGETALHLACRMANVAMVTKLLDAGSDVNLTLNNGGTALHCACQAAEPEIVDMLLECGSEVNVTRSGRGVNDITPLHDATEVGNLESVKLLLDKGVVVDCEKSTKSTPLHTASKYGYLDIVEELLSRGADVSKQGSDSKGVNVQAIHIASENNHIDVIKALVEAGADLNVRRVYAGQNGISSLHLAIIKGHKEATELLLKLGHEPSPVDHDGFSPLHIAAKLNQLSLAETLIKAGAEVNSGAASKSCRNQTPLHYATRHKHHDMVRLLLDSGAEVNTSENMPLKPSRKSTRSTSEGDDSEEVEVGLAQSYTALHWAAENGDLTMVQLLLSFDADINKEASFECHAGVTALHLASQDGYTDVVRELAHASGCDKNPRKSTYNRESITPLHQAVYNGHSLTAGVLIESGADVNIQADNGYAAIHYAAQQGDLSTTKLLIEHGANVNLRASAKNQQDLTPLHLAVQSGDLEVIQQLAQAGSELNAVKTMGEVYGVTPLHQAVYQEKKEVVSALLRLGCDVNTSMDGWYSPLHIAAERGSKDILIELLRHKADINQRASHDDHLDVAPIHVAAQHGHSEVVRFLLSGGADIEAQRKFVDRSKMTSLHLAAENGFVETVSVLCQMGANIDQQDSLGFAALHLAIQYGFNEVVDELLARGASLKTKTLSGLTPHSLAESMGNSKMAAKLKEQKRKRDSDKRKSFSPRGLSNSNPLRALLCGMGRSK